MKPLSRMVALALGRYGPAALATRLLALWKLLRHPATPWPAKAVAALVLVYVASPIDLIPDFIPVIGYLDDLLLLPLGLWLVVRLTPPEVIATAREKAALATEKPVSRAAAVAVVGLWLVLALVCARWLFE